MKLYRKNKQLVECSDGSHMSSARRAFMPLAAVIALFGFSACSDWTRPESVELHIPTLEEQNPELYARYMESLRAYKNSDHKVLITKFDNSDAVLSGRADHINCLPDSVDYVILDVADNLLPEIVSEIAEIREKKGTETLYTVSFDAMESDYAAYAEQWELDHPATGDSEDSVSEDAAGEDEQPVETMQTFGEFLADRTEYMLSIAEKYGYGGVNICYTGVFPGSLPEDAKAELLANQTVFFDAVTSYMESRSDKIFMFEGMPVNILYDRSFLNGCRYIIVDASDAVNENELTFDVEMAMSDDTPSDRMVVNVTVPSIDDPTDNSGYFSATGSDGEQVRAITGAAMWACVSSDMFVRAGICVDDAQNDYYDIMKSYRYIREAISIMNPSPLN